MTTAIVVAIGHTHDSPHTPSSLRYLGKPSEALVGRVRNETIRHFCRTEIPDLGAIPFEELYPDAGVGACDLLSRLLVFDPVRRAWGGEGEGGGCGKGGGGGRGRGGEA